MIYTSFHNTNDTPYNFTNPKLQKGSHNSLRKASLKELDEADTLATNSCSQILDQNFIGLDINKAKILNIDIQGKSFEIDCCNAKIVKKFLKQLSQIRELGQKVVQVKMVILDSIAKINPLFEPLLDEVCKEYASRWQKKIFQRND